MCISNLGAKLDHAWTIAFRPHFASWKDDTFLQHQSLRKQKNIFNQTINNEFHQLFQSFVLSLSVSILGKKRDHVHLHSCQATFGFMKKMAHTNTKSIRKRAQSLFCFCVLQFWERDLTLHVTSLTIFWFMKKMARFLNTKVLMIRRQKKLVNQTIYIMSFINYFKVLFYSCLFPYSGKGTWPIPSMPSHIWVHEKDYTQTQSQTRKKNIFNNSEYNEDSELQYQSLVLSLSVSILGKELDHEGVFHARPHFGSWK